MAVANLVSDAGNHLALVWRSNHPPYPPFNVTVADGGWVLGNLVALQVSKTDDIDGDRLEYRFRVASEDGALVFRSGSNAAAYAFVEGLEHGSYHWAVEARDPLGGSSGWTTGWWFRFDKEPPTAITSIGYIADEGALLVLDGSASFDDGPLERWEWDTDGDGTYDIACEGPEATTSVGDDGTYNIRLRVTDEAGRSSVTTVPLWVQNSPPSIEIRGQARVYDEAVFKAVTSDPVDEDDLVVTWSVDGAASGTGPEFLYVPISLHEHLISASVSDGDGGCAVAVLRVNVSTEHGVVIEVLRPDQAVAGQSYTLGLDSVSLGLYEGSEIIWKRDGTQVGTGPELVLVAGRGPTERIEVGLIDDGTFILANTTVIGIRESLLPVEVLDAEVTSYSSIVVRWNTSVQRDLFTMYIIRMSTDPLPHLPGSDLAWLGVGGTPASEYQEIAIRSLSIHEFTGLKSDRTYYFCVYVVGTSEVACSNSVEASIPPQNVDDVRQPTGDDEEMAAHRMLISVVLAIILLPTFGVYIMRSLNVK
jgi:hypothetical protein